MHAALVLGFLAYASHARRVQSITERLAGEPCGAHDVPSAVTRTDLKDVGQMLARARPSESLVRYLLALNPAAAHGAQAFVPPIPTDRLGMAYSIGGVASVLSWAACAISALATYKPHRIIHNTIGVLQAFTAIPVIWACFAALANAEDRTAPEIRQLNLGVAAASIWSAITVLWAPTFTAATVRTSDPVCHPWLLATSTSIVHLVVAGLCMGAWRGAAIDKSLSGLLSHVIASPWKLMPLQASDTLSLAAEHSTLATVFAGYTAIALCAPFPLATVPSLLGKRLARAYGAWTLLVCVALRMIKDAAEHKVQNNMLQGLKGGIRLMARSHLLVSIVRPLLEKPSLYPAAMACKPAVVFSLVVFAHMSIGAVK